MATKPKRKHAGGRTPKLTPEVQTAICDSLKFGNTLQDAAIKAGVGKSTLFLWLQQAKGPKPQRRFLEFLDAIERAQAEYRVIANAQMIQHAKKHWQALAWFLERTQSKFYGLQIKVQVERELERMMDKMERSLTPQEYERALEAISEPDDSFEEVGEASRGGGPGRHGHPAGVGAAIDAALSEPASS